MTLSSPSFPGGGYPRIFHASCIRCTYSLMLTPENTPFKRCRSPKRCNDSSANMGIDSPRQGEQYHRGLCQRLLHHYYPLFRHPKNHIQRFAPVTHPGWHHRQGQIGHRTDSRNQPPVIFTTHFYFQDVESTDSLPKATGPPPHCPC